jgi:2-polyprenyl-3-methyl-5-hydroxy-6-metoxy-1,4-benzoquinol methylase
MRDGHEAIQPPALMQTYYDAYWTREAPPPVGDPLAAVRLRLLRAHLSATGAERVLEAGCGLGDIAAALTSDGIAATGMDISSEAVAGATRAHAGPRFVRHSVEELPWPVESASFDAVASFEVIEHLIEPRKLLLGAHAALRPGGHIAITTPYHGLIKNVGLAMHGFDTHFGVEGDHIRFFSDGALRRLLDETGFEVERVVHFGRAWPVWAGVFVWATRR